MPQSQRIGKDITAKYKDKFWREYSNREKTLSKHT